MVKPDYVLILDAHPVEDGRIQKHIRFLNDSGYTVYHIHFIPYASEPDVGDGKYSLFGEKSWHVNLHWKIRYKGLRLLNYLSLFSPALAQKTTDAIRALGIPPASMGIIHVHDPILLPLAKKIRSSYLTQCAIVYDRHEIYDRMKRFGGISGYGLFEKTVRRDVQGVVVVSDYHIKSAAGTFSDTPIVCIPNFPLGSMFDHETIQKKIEVFSRDSIILCSYIGSLRNDYDRDVSLLLDVSQLLMEKCPRVNITIGGPCSDQDILDRLSKLSDSFPGRFQYTGPIPYKQASMITQESHIGFYFLKNQEAGHVGSPNKVYEYLFCGVIPVLKGTIDYASEFVDCSHFCSQNDDAEQIATAIEHIIMDTDRVEKMINCAHNLGQSFTWDHVAGHYVELYEKILPK